MSAQLKQRGPRIAGARSGNTVRSVPTDPPRKPSAKAVVITRNRGRNGGSVSAITPTLSRDRSEALRGRDAIRPRPQPRPIVADTSLLHPLLPDTGSYPLEVSVVLGTHNRLALLQRCVSSIRRACSGLMYEIVVAVGASTDGTEAWLAEQSDVVVVDGGMEGAVKAFNAAWRRSRGRFVVALNDDAEIYDDAVRNALRYFADPFVGQVAMSFLESGRWKSERLYQNYPYANFAVTRANLLSAIASICGGMWAKIYFTYGGDSELSCWVHRLGYKVVEAKDARVRHDEHRDEMRRNNVKSDTARRNFFRRWPSPDRLKFRGPPPAVRPDELSVLTRLEMGETPQERWPRIAALDPEIGHLPPNRLPSKERVLQLHLWTAEDPQASMAQAFAKLGSAGHTRIDWTKIASTTERDRALIEAARDLQPTIVFLQLQAAHVISPAAIQAIRDAPHDPSMVVCVWSGDVGPTNGPWPGQQDAWSYEIARRVDLMLFTGTGQVKLHRERGMPNAAYLQIGYDEDRYRIGTDEEWGSRHDVVFLGQDYNRQYNGLPDSEAQLRRDAVRRLKTLPGAGVFGAGWGTQGKPQHEAGDTYRTSKMSVSISLTSKLARYTSDRLIRSMACGTAAVVKRFDDMAGLGLVEDENCIGWDTVDEMADKVAYWSRPDNEAELRQIALHGADLMSSQHTWDVRMHELAALVGAVRGR
jgi:glycosyltransferase involved in cell wall biosynthesis